MPGWAGFDNKIKHVVPADYLFTASLWGFYDLLELRLRSQPDPLLIRSKRMKHNALQLACKNGNCNVAEFLLDRGWGLQVENGYPLLGLAINGLLEVIECSSLSSLAMDDKHVETVRLLLSRGADPNEKCKFGGIWGSSTFPIIKAVELGSTELVRLLLDYGASADVEDSFGLRTFHLAVTEGEEETADLLLAASSYVDEFPRIFCREVALVHKTVRADDEALLNTALEQWPQDVRGNKYLNSALWWVVYSGGTRASVKALLAKGADVNFQHNGESVIEVCNRYGWPGEERDHMRQLLLDHGAVLEEWE